MVITKLTGGLGNQMFQYAVGKMLAIKHKTNLKLDIFEFKKRNQLRSYSLKYFNIEENIASKKDVREIIGCQNKYIKKLYNKFIRRNIENNLMKEKFFHFNPDTINISNNTYLQGYWQSEKNFYSIKDTIRKEFSLKNEYNNLNTKLLDNINKTNSVSLHIRRGDYIENKMINQLHDICNLEYYQKAIKTILQKIKSPVFFIFSDDIEWVKKNFNTKQKLEYISSPILKDYEELILMSKCKHNIIANSSFSWWGAWLNNNPDKIIISPKKWLNDSKINTKDIIPENWIKI